MKRRSIVSFSTKKTCKKHPAILLSSIGTGVSCSRAADSYQILLALLQHREVTVISKRLKKLCHEMLLRSSCPSANISPAPRQSSSSSFIFFFFFFFFSVFCKQTSVAMNKPWWRSKATHVTSQPSWHSKHHSRLPYLAKRNPRDVPLLYH